MLCVCVTCLNNGQVNYIVCQKERSAMENCNCGAKQKFEPRSLFYTRHALNCAIMPSMVLVSSCNCLWTSKTPLPRLYISLGQDLSLISSHPGTQLSAWHGLSSQGTFAQRVNERVTMRWHKNLLEGSNFPGVWLVLEVELCYKHVLLPQASVGAQKTCWMGRKIMTDFGFLIDMSWSLMKQCVLKDFSSSDGGASCFSQWSAHFQNSSKALAFWRGIFGRYLLVPEK